MHTIVIGVRHRTAPIAIREKLAFTAAEIPDALQAMMALPGIEEAAILTTCNRTEIYATVSDTEQGIRALKKFLNETKQFNYSQYLQYVFMLMHEDAVMHLFRVASGLDSLVLGEGQIMAQVKDALKTAILAQSAGETIDKMFKTALSVGKAVRSETGITNRDISVSRAAFEFTQTHHPDMLNRKIALIGAGKMAEILMASLRSAVPKASRQAEQIVLVNRTPEHVEAQSEKYGFPGYGWEELPRILQEYDVLFVATSSPHFVLKPEMFTAGVGPKIIIDISVPRNVDPVIGEQSGIALYNTDDLSGYSGYTGEHRQQLIQLAHQIIEREYEKYHQWRVSRVAVPIITQLRAQIEQTRRIEVANTEAHCPHVQQSCSVIDNLSRTLINKILHDPTVKMRSTPHLEEIYTQAEFIRSLFNLPKLPTTVSADCHTDSPAVLRPAKATTHLTAVAGQKAI